MDNCQFKAKPTPFAGECKGDTAWIVPNYFTKQAPVKDKNVHLCEAHAQMWNQIHPFGPRAIKESDK